MLVARFADHLAPGFTAAVDARKLASELRSLRRLVRHYYDRKPVVDVWQCLLRYRRADLPVLCRLVEVAMCVAVSDRFVARCFGFATAALMHGDGATPADLLLLRANHAAWSAEEREQLIADALAGLAASGRREGPGDDRRRGGSFDPPPRKTPRHDRRELPVSPAESDTQSDGSDSDSDYTVVDDIRDRDTQDADGDRAAGDVDAAQENTVAASTGTVLLQSAGLDALNSFFRDEKT